MLPVLLALLLHQLLMSLTLAATALRRVCALRHPPAETTPTGGAAATARTAAARLQTPLRVWAWGLPMAVARRAHGMAAALRDYHGDNPAGALLALVVGLPRSWPRVQPLSNWLLEGKVECPSRMHLPVRAQALYDQETVIAVYMLFLVAGNDVDLASVQIWTGTHRPAH